jgi:hypothetical protein
MSSIHPGPGLAKCPALSDEEYCNSRAKARFAERLVELGLHEMSVRDLAADVLGVAKSTLHERLSSRRRDLAPLPEWFEKLDRYEALVKLSREFGVAL